ncbi:MAG: hypothetical protein PHO32_04045, partial [Candidatus Cloacimonetes bacterium]|nr:hypothetical protein [Candidatus Cloacimonadota bacterium]
MKQVLLYLMLLNTTLMLALSGTYTVGGSSADYSTLATAIIASNTEGLSGDTEFVLNPGTYSGPFTLQHAANGHELKITSGSAPSGSVILNNPTATTEINYVIRIEAVSQVKLQGLRFETTGSLNRAVFINGNADETSITSCFFQGGVGASSNNSGAIYIAASGSGDTDNLYLALNNFQDGGYHIVVNSSSYNDLFSDWEILNNYFADGYLGLYLLRFSNLQLQDNTLEDM